jgi:hypothetical protein
VSVFNLDTNFGSSFNLCAPGAFSFGYPRALSEIDSSVFSLTIDSVVSKPTTYPSTLVEKSFTVIT